MGSHGAAPFHDHHQNDDPLSRDFDARSERDAHSASRTTSIGRRAALPALLFIVLLVALSLRLIGLPVSRIIEARYCVDYYATHDPSAIGDDGEVPESMCKVDAVQENLGWMSGALETTMLACDIASATPLAYVADRMGRRSVVFMNLTAMAVRLLWIAFVGQAKSIAVTAMLAAPFIGLYGGGSCVNQSIMLSIISDLAETEAERPMYISWVNSLLFITGLFGPSLAALLMEGSLWLPIWIGLAMLLGSIPFLGLLPASKIEQVRRRVRRSSGLTSQETMLLLGQDIQHDPSTHGRVSSRERKERSSVSRTILNFLRGYLDLISSSPQFQTLLVAFFLTGFASSSSALLPLYLTKRYGWTFAQIGIIFSFKAIVNLVMSLAIVPGYSRYMAKASTTGKSDLLGTKMTLIVSVFGIVMIALSTKKWMAVFSLCIYAIGSVVGVFMYSLSRSSQLDILNEENESRGFALIVLIHSIGGLVGTPVMTAMWVGAISVGGRGIGTPLYVSAAAYAVCLMVMGRLHL